MRDEQLIRDIDAIVARRHDNGGDFWASADGKLYIGNPFSTLASLGMLHELGVDRDHEAVGGGLELVLDACRDDGRIRLGPRTPLYPCYTAEAARVLCRFGLHEHEALLRTVDYLLHDAHDAGGWRCNFTKFGRGPETACANPGATLYALDVLRFFDDYRGGNDTVDEAVGFLLDHWDVRKPLGPCHWGIGTLFFQVEYPFLRYNLFYYTYVLSFFERARGDARFDAAMAELESKLDAEGNVVVERPHRALGRLGFCSKGEPSRPATARFAEIRQNLAG
jgi:hypothetical protein